MWWGDLLRGATTTGGPQYLRNRYCDANTGRFTQEDPIGLAGGLNLYGFAGGDPVNFTDPFGLCPEQMGGTKDGGGWLGDCPTGSKGADRFAWLQKSSGSIESAEDPISFIYGGGEAKAAVSLLAVARNVGGNMTKDVIGHIFKERAGHISRNISEGSMSRYARLFQRVAANSANLDNSVLPAASVAAGAKGFSQTFKRGQVWVHVNPNGQIRSAGINR